MKGGYRQDWSLDGQLHAAGFRTTSTIAREKVNRLDGYGWRSTRSSGRTKSCSPHHINTYIQHKVDFPSYAFNIYPQPFLDLVLLLSSTISFTIPSSYSVTSSKSFPSCPSASASSRAPSTSPLCVVGSGSGMSSPGTSVAACCAVKDAPPGILGPVLLAGAASSAVSSSTPLSPSGWALVSDASASGCSTTVSGVSTASATCWPRAVFRNSPFVVSGVGGVICVAGIAILLAAPPVCSPGG